MYVVEMAFAVILMSFSGGDDISIILMSFSVPRMTWHTIRDDTAEHGMYVVEMAFVVILMSFFNAQDDMAHHTG